MPKSEYVQQRLREVRVEPRAARVAGFRFDRRNAQVLWSLSHGRYVLCDLKNGTCEELAEQPTPLNRNAPR